MRPTYGFKLPLTVLVFSGLLASSCGDDGSDDVDSETSAAGKGCSAKRLAAGDQSFTIMHGGAARTYLLHVPPAYDGKKAVPLVIDMHGLMSNASQQRGFSGWTSKADQEGFLVANPDGLNSSWNAGELCCGSSQQNKVDDEGFIRALVTELKRTACIDNKRVYATGLSNGGAMSHLLACRASDVFAAVAPVAMGNGTRPCQPARPVSVFMARATGDNLVPYEGGGFIDVPSAQADFDQWKTLNGCTGEPKVTNTFCKSYDQCNAGVEVSQCTVQTRADDLGTLGGHILYGPAAAQGFVLADAIWEVFKRQTLP